MISWSKNSLWSKGLSGLLHIFANIVDLCKFSEADTVDPDQTAPSICAFILALLCMLHFLNMFDIIKRVLNGINSVLIIMCSCWYIVKLLENERIDLIHLKT